MTGKAGGHTQGRTLHAAAKPVGGYRPVTPHAAIELAIADHQAYAGACVDWDFVGMLRTAQDDLRRFGLVNEENVRLIREAYETNAEFAALRAQRDELAAALREYADNDEQRGAKWLAARAALAKVQP